MAYAAVVSLKNTLQHYVNSPQNPSLPQTSVEILLKEIESLQELLQSLDSNNKCSRDKASAVDSRIRDAVYQLEDILESTHQYDLSFEIESFAAAMKKRKDEYSQVLDQRQDDAVSISSFIDGNKSIDNNIFGLSDDNITQLKRDLTQRRSYEIHVVPVFGEAGSGRSVLANYAFSHPSVVKHFDKRVWVSVGPNYRLKQILISLLFQLLDHNRKGNYRLFSEEREDDEEENLAHLLRTSLKERVYLVALDNVCDSRVWEYFRRVLPEEFNGSRVLMTTSVKGLMGGLEFIKDWYEMKGVEGDECWDIFVSLVFGDGCSCPASLEIAGRRIARSCKGLLVEITKVARSLCKSQRQPEYWNALAAQRENYVLTDAYDELAEISRGMEDLELGNLFYADADDLYARTDFGRIIFEKPELYNVVEKIVRNLVVRVDLHPPRLPEIFSLTGMAGIGKTTLAKKIFEDVSTLKYFDHHVWITLGPKYGSERLLEDILYQIDPSVNKLQIKEESMLARHFRTVLSGKKCLIVLDDIWRKEPLFYLRRLPSETKLVVLLTSRIQTLTHQSDQVYKMCFLNKEQSWRLLCEKVFGNNPCPSELRKLGQVIAENCEGLPLLIIAVASLLSRAEQTPKFWNEASNKDSSLFEHAHEEIKHVVFSSYEYLPQRLKASFLYMGIFPRNFKIPSSRIFTLWGLEGILEPSFSGNLEEVGIKYMKELVSRSLVIVLEEISYLRIDSSTLHSVFWHLCTREARKDKFFLVLKRLVDGTEEHMRSQRRLCIQNNVLFSIKDVHNMMSSISTVRSLLCTGPPQPYPVPIYFGSELLKVVDALHIHLYDFPIKLVNLLLLKYLSLTCDGQLPPSISELKNLECLILRHYLSIRSHASLSYLPSQIWHMQKLQHLQVTGSELPAPCGDMLPNLLTLLDLSAYSCNKDVLLGTPHLRELGIQIELLPNASETWSSSAFSFECISHLHELKSLECCILNPELTVPSPTSLFYALPSHLKELSLSGLGYSWECMKHISCLSHLEVLKLRSYAFRGPEWVIYKGEFNKLRYLLLEDTDLECWRTEGCSIGHWHLILRHCYKLRKIPLLDLVTKVEVVDCNPVINREIPSSWLVKNIAHIHSSWK